MPGDLKVWSVKLVQDGIAGFVGDAIVVAATRDEAIALVKASLGEHDETAEVDEAEAEPYDVDTPRLLYINYWDSD